MKPDCTKKNWDENKKVFMKKYEIFLFRNTSTSSLCKKNTSEIMKKWNNDHTFRMNYYYLEPKIQFKRNMLNYLTNNNMICELDWKRIFSFSVEKKRNIFYFYTTVILPSSQELCLQKEYQKIIHILKIVIDVDFFRAQKLFFHFENSTDVLHFFTRFSENRNHWLIRNSSVKNSNYIMPNAEMITFSRKEKNRVIHNRFMNVKGIGWFSFNKMTIAEHACSFHTFLTHLKLKSNCIPLAVCFFDLVELYRKKKELSYYDLLCRI